MDDRSRDERVRLSKSAAVPLALGLVVVCGGVAEVFRSTLELQAKYSSPQILQQSMASVLNRSAAPTVAATQPWMSAFILLGSSLALVYAVFAYAHSRVLNADMMELQRLHTEGVLSSGTSAIQDFETVSELLNAIAPAVYMRQEMWLRTYYHTLRIAHASHMFKGAVQRELGRVAAYQAGNYRVACGHLAQLRSF